ncbi:hypothetical protein EB796_000187 [Bugula neritina]|uniref:Uncharacterized protein n=1 Tax=Bugula neritina TaxID=10212 RepID=A0A7J7KTW8_BUGNE|nr:hypothetical protein EB796_000187 [Bugula neritina]
MEDSKFDESDVSEEITRQLAEIDIDANSELETPEDVTTSLEVSPIDLKLLHNLEHRLSSQRKAFEKQLKDCSDLLDSAAGMLM